MKENQKVFYKFWTGATRSSINTFIDEAGAQIKKMDCNREETFGNGSRSPDTYVDYLEFPTKLTRVEKITKSSLIFWPVFFYRHQLKVSLNTLEKSAYINSTNGELLWTNNRPSSKTFIMTELKPVCFRC